MSKSGFFLWKQKTAYEMRISDWSSDVCSSRQGAKREIAEIGTPPTVRGFPSAFPPRGSSGGLPAMALGGWRRGFGRRVFGDEGYSDRGRDRRGPDGRGHRAGDRKSTRLNSSH